jgi:hypothetical protein
LLRFFAKIILGQERNAEGAEENAEDGARELPAGVAGHAVWQILRLVRLAPDFAQDDRRKTRKGKSRLLASLGMTKERVRTAA